MKYAVWCHSLDDLKDDHQDIAECPRRLPVFEPSMDAPGYPKKNVKRRTFYPTPDGRWIEHVVKLDPKQPPSGVLDRFREVSPAYVIQTLGFLRKGLPPGLDMLKPYMEAMRRQEEAMRRQGGFIWYGPRTQIEPVYPESAQEPNRQTQTERTSEAPAELPDLVTLDQAAAVVHRKKQRGRTAGVDKIGLALTEVVSRLKRGESIELSDIAESVKCTRKNLERSKRFMAGYQTLAQGERRAVCGSKQDGRVEAYEDPDEDF